MGCSFTYSFKNAIGTVVINSTVGISSLYHETPTICLGDAIYDIEGLTSLGLTIDEFWSEYKEVDTELFKNLGLSDQNYSNK